MAPPTPPTTAPTGPPTMAPPTAPVVAPAAAPPWAWAASGRAKKAATAVAARRRLVMTIPFVRERSTRRAGRRSKPSAGGGIKARPRRAARGRLEHALRRRQEPVALGLLAGELARAAHRLGLLARLLLGRLLVRATLLHLAEDALALHALLQHPQGLVDVVVADEYLQVSSDRFPGGKTPVMRTGGSRWLQKWCAFESAAS